MQPNPHLPNDLWADVMKPVEEDSDEWLAAIRKNFSTAPGPSQFQMGCQYDEGRLRVLQVGR